MPIVPKASVRVNLTLAILLTVVLSWVISGGISNYFNYLSFRAFRQEMMKRPAAQRRPIPEPKFGITEFLTGRPPISMKTRENRPSASSDKADKNEDPLRMPDGPPPGPSRSSMELRGMLLRIAVALLMATIVGTWLGRRFTRPLTQLAKGADEFQSGNLSYRIPAGGNSEFAAVAKAMNEMARQVSDQISHLEEDAQRRRQFLADVAHELRSPVTSMETMAGALQDGLADEPERRDFAISALVATSQRMRRLVQDVMELARVDLTELPLSLTQVDLRDLATSAIKSHEVEATTAGIELLPLVSSSPVSAVVDPDRITQVLDNIIGNAISYAGQNAQITISLNGGNPIRIDISDTGKGIRAEDMPYVIDPFYRADSARTPDDCHSGLGLSIASKLVEAHGGTLNVSSEEGKGTVVSILLPAPAPSTTVHTKPF